METPQELLEMLEAMGVVITIKHIIPEHQFKNFWRTQAKQWTGSMSDCVYIPITQVAVKLESPVTGNYSNERSILGDNFFRRG